MSTIRLTAAQAMVRWLAAQKTADGEPFIAGCWAIFGHGNVAGMGEALHGAGDALPTWRGHNEQTMAHAAIAYAKALNRQRAMMVTTSIGPGALNLVTAAALAHVNRLPVLLVPGDVFANRAPDPVLQQVEDFGDGTVSANDCFKPVSRYFDRIARPEQLLTALPRAMATMTDPVDCGPVTLAFCQDVQAEAYDWPETFFTPRTWHIRRPQPDARELAEAAEAIRGARKPLIIAGGGVLYSLATQTLTTFAETHQIPVAETQAGKSSLPWDHPLNLGAIGVTGSSAANAVAAEADLVIAVGTRLQDFTTGSWALFRNPDRRILAVNVTPYDAGKHRAIPLVADAKVALEALSAALGGHKAAAPEPQLKAEWLKAVDAATMAPGDNVLPSDAQVIGAVQRSVGEDTILVCAAGGLPGELHKLWKASRPNGYHLEYGFSCMGYEIAGGLGVKMARPDREVVVMVGDGSYMMANSELATAVMLGQKIIVVVLDNRGYGCINRLQRATGGESFNNLLDTARHAVPSAIDFAAHAASMGANAQKVASIAELEEAMARARKADRPSAIVIDTDPMPTTEAGGHWWDVAVPEVSVRPEVNAARAAYEKNLKNQRPAD
ncbi:3D-(3,5/4)-trihydroxycyclohexane-1,2-dione acylhydrolase (decyclizing) [Chelatococcus daeguensis]|uniref:3D-(3,5/4)-trihydroxycyclohexane-1,2-dione acylhydrolase (Decyclizing) n=1 Tax=Chelatococcus daeguensis TaxID=444444 RepID=A0AAC9JNX6_9HYPH|nr:MULTISPECIES: 3D-(3,5/4)-trihydroxycyclohexane-1,2-dione acylhydrolase (decyclizing) [Chelatococcus]APF37003.1 3D-(3,5/4)-trihydroxycyclohexane-1,2-dione acylhydrolase (decyclizing) [Chelatococcus daeguensis]KZE33636.1 3D-(3,5/4)-trihydroxycyclohexane-1,2-dione acylhydrolase (decyclizing) [Chelatococcus daeguensis]MBM3084779.1 3D-(3,5/4)-trihydroxycyclohexane-1,2-dione acylhydrolase (decyclizing) [Chelatococcus daeguensis]